MFNSLTFHSENNKIHVDHATYKMKAKKFMFSYIFIILCLPLIQANTKEKEKPLLKLEPKDKLVLKWINESFFTTCHKIKETKDHEADLKWFDKYGNEINEKDGSKDIHISETNQFIRLIFLSTKKRDSGNYTCKIIKKGKVLQEIGFSLQVYKRQIVTGRDEELASEGETFSMTCAANFDPGFTLTSINWLFNNNILDKGGRFENKVVEQNGRDAKTLKNTLTIRNIAKEDEGTYICRSIAARDTLIGIVEKSVNLRVQYKPRRFPQDSSTVWIDRNALNQKTETTINITCMVNSDPPSSISWYTMDGIQIGDERRRHDRIKSQLTSIINQENMSTLGVKFSLKKTNRYQYDKFKCVAQNSLGQIETIYQIKVGNLPRAPIVSDVAYSDGVLNVTIEEGERIDPPIDMYRVTISDRLHPHINASTDSFGSNNTYSISIELPPGQQQVKIFAHNPVGWSDATLFVRGVLVSGSQICEANIMILLFLNCLALITFGKMS